MSVRDLGFQHWSSQIDKVKQLYSQILVRHGVMLVGPTGGGKTTTRSILQRALVLLPSLQSEEEPVGPVGRARRLSIYLVRSLFSFCKATCCNLLFCQRKKIAVIPKTTYYTVYVYATDKMFCLSLFGFTRTLFST